MALSLNQKPVSTGKKFERIGEGTYPGRLVQVIDFGLQQETDWQTQEVKLDDNGNEVWKPKVWLTFELPDETIEIDGEDKPRWISKEYNLSFHEKSALTAVVNAMSTGGEKTLADFLGKAALIQVGSTRTNNDKIVGVTKVIKGMTVGELQNDPVSFDFSDPDRKVYDGLPNFMKEKIQDGAKCRGGDKVSAMLDMPSTKAEDTKKESLGDDELPF